MRKKAKFGFFILSILIFSAIFPQLPIYDPISSTQTEGLSVSENSTKKFENMAQSFSQKTSSDRKEYLLLLKSEKYVNTFVNKFSPQILHQYHTFPLLFVRISETQKHILESLPIIEATYPNKKISLPSYSQKNGNNSNKISPQSLSSSKSIKADTFWEQGYKGSGSTITIVDTGIYSHVELKDRIVAERSFVKEKFGYETNLSATEGLNPHGTMVAGVAAGSGKENYGQGVAPKASLINARVFPGGDQPHATVAGIIAAIEWSIGQNTNVINLSLGSSTSWYSTPGMHAVNEAVRRGVTVVAAAGNAGGSGTWSMSIGGFGSAKNVLTVGATANGETSSIATSYSSIGPSVKAAVKPDIAAPSGIFTTTLYDGYTDVPVRGTSFSAPHVSGAAALLGDFLKEKGINSQQPSIIKGTLMKTADPVINSGKRYGELYAGKGSVNLDESYRVLTSTPHKPYLLTVSPSYIPQGLTNTSNAFYPHAKTLFNDERLAFNFTLASTYNSTVSVNFKGNFTSALTIESSKNFEIHVPTSLWEFKACVNNIESGSYQGIIQFSTERVTLNVSIAFQLEDPSGRVLWDMKHTSWMNDFIYGQYRHLYQRFVQLNVAVDMWRFHSSRKAVDILDPALYDLVFMPDTASYPPSWIINKGLLDYDATLFSKEEISAFHNYVKQGGDLCILAMGKHSNNFTNLNMLTRNFGIEYTGKMISNEHHLGITAEMSGHILAKGVQNISFSGSHLSTTHSLVLPFTRYGNNPVMAYSKFLTGGVFASATNFMFDNKRFETAPYKESSSNLVQNLLKLAQEGETFLSNFETSPSHPQLEDKINVNITTSKSIQLARGVASDYLGLIRFNLVSQGNVYNGSFRQTRIAGNVWIGVNLSLSSGWTLVYSKDPLTISYGSTSPTITGTITTAGYRNGTVKNWTFSPLNLKFVISDDKGLNYSTIYSQLLTLSSHVSFSYVLIQAKKNSWIVNITFPTDSIQKTMINYHGHLRVNITALDLATNLAHTYLVIQLTDPTPPSLTILSPNPEQSYHETTSTIEAKWNSSDKESGIKEFIAELDKNFSKEIHPEEGITTEKFFSLIPGKHQLIITAINHMNLTTTKIVTFYIGNPPTQPFSFSIRWIISGAIGISVALALTYYIYKKRKS